MDSLFAYQCSFFLLTHARFMNQVLSDVGPADFAQSVKTLSLSLYVVLRECLWFVGC